MKKLFTVFALLLVVASLSSCGKTSLHESILSRHDAVAGNIDVFVNEPVVIDSYQTTKGASTTAVLRIETKDRLVYLDSVVYGHINDTMHFRNTIDARKRDTRRRQQTAR